VSTDYARLVRDPTALIRETYGGVLQIGGFYLYGAGNVGRKMLAALQADGHRVKGFLDNSPALRDGEVAGLPVCRFEDLRPEAADVCVVTIWNYRHDFRASAEHARRLGFKTVMHFSALAVLGGYQGIFPNYAVDHPSVVFTPDFEANHAALMAALADDASRELADQVLGFHALPTPERLPPLSARPLPFDAGQVRTYVDCGAFVGDDFESHRADFNGLETAWLIEPDPATFETLKARSFPGLNAIPTRAAVSREAGVIRFAAEGHWGSKIVDGDDSASTVEVETLTLDSLPLGDGMAYVKMDVEGHELAALEGAHRLLSDHTTIFGVTLEHRAQDLFEVPALLARYPHRRNYLFAHDTEFAMDMVVYSVPA
jgi:FkbM family methyltransferase